MLLRAAFFCAALAAALVGRLSVRRRARSPTAAATVGPIYLRSPVRRAVPAGPHRPAAAIGVRLHLAADTSPSSAGDMAISRIRRRPGTAPVSCIAAAPPSVGRVDSATRCRLGKRRLCVPPSTELCSAGLGLWRRLRHGGVLGHAWRAVGIRPRGLFPAIPGRSRLPAMAPAGHARPYDGGAIGGARRQRERGAARCGRNGSRRIGRFVHRLGRVVRRRGSIRVAVAGASQSRAAPRRKFRSGHLGQRRDTLPCRPNHPA